MGIEKLTIQAFCLEQMGQTKRAMTTLRPVELQNLKQAMVGGVILIHNDPAAPTKNWSPLCFRVGFLFAVVTLTYLIAFSVVCWLLVSWFLSQYKLKYIYSLNVHKNP